MHNTLKIFIFTAFFAPLITHGMSQQNKIELGKQLIEATRKGNLPRFKILISEDADLNQKDTNGFTALMLAVLHNRPEILQMLIDAGADLNQEGYLGYTALSYAAYINRPKMCRVIALTHFTRQKELVYITSLCLKRIFGMEYPHIRNIFKPILEAMFKESWQPMLNEINRIRNSPIRLGIFALTSRCSE